MSWRKVGRKSKNFWADQNACDTNKYHDVCMFSLATKNQYLHVAWRKREAGLDFNIMGAIDLRALPQEHERYVHTRHRSKVMMSYPVSVPKQS
jgi:hypothetical protein